MKTQGDNNGNNGRLNLGFILRALGSRNYRLFFAGQGISLIGTWIQRIAQAWLVYRLTDSVFMLGLVGFSTQIPTFLMAPFAGVITDQRNRYHILLVAQILAALQAVILAVLVLTDLVQVWHIIVLGIVLGLVNAFEMPSRQSLIIELIERREDLSNAIALNSTMFNGARLIGPTVAGILIGVFGEGICFIINAGSFLAVIAALAAMKLDPAKMHKRKGAMAADIKEGFAYAYGFLPIRAILLLIGMTGLMGMPYVVLMPVFARDVLGGGPDTLGFLMASIGTGALIGALYLASRRTVVGLDRVIPFAVGTFGVGLVLFSLSRQLWLSMAILFFVGISSMLQMASSNTLMQTLVDDDKRGRVMSMFAMSFFGTVPLGNFLAGSLGSRIGTPATVMVGGICCIISALYFLYFLPAIRKCERPVYRRKGILPEVATGLQAADSVNKRP